MSVLKRYAFLFFSLVFYANLAWSKQTLFDGYFRLTLGDKPIGYMVQVYEYDDKAKTFHTAYFLKTNKLGGDIQESLKAVSNNKFEPISYAYTSKSGDKVRTIDASFKGEVMKLTITDGKMKRDEAHKIPKGTFLSSFLGYLMLQKGISVDKKFSYSAVAEEEGNSYSGEAWVKERTEYLSQPSFRILNKFKGSQFISFMNEKGEVLGTTSPENNISSRLMPSAAEATKDFLVPNQTLNLLFGKVPSGKVNALHPKDSETPVQSPEKKPTKEKDSTS